MCKGGTRLSDIWYQRGVITLHIGVDLFTFYLYNNALVCPSVRLSVCSSEPYLLLHFSMNFKSKPIFGILMAAQMF